MTMENGYDINDNNKVVVNIYVYNHKIICW